MATAMVEFDKPEGHRLSEGTIPASRDSKSYRPDSRFPPHLSSEGFA